MIRFLHIGKTGGTAIRHALATSQSRTADIVIAGHELTLADVTPGEKVVFFLRAPPSRFVSAFYSRFREGQPATYRPWKPEERIAFERFQTANRLAEALSDPDPETRGAAEHAMRSIGHVRSSFYDWVGSDAYLESRLGDILLIGFQETLAADFQFLKACGAMHEDAELPHDEVASHRTPRQFDTSLSESGHANLLNWYARDVELYRHCAELRLRLWGRESSVAEALAPPKTASGSAR